MAIMPEDTYQNTYRVNASTGIEVFDLSEIIFICTTDPAYTLKVWYRNGAVLTETGQWSKSAIDDFITAWRDYKDKGGKPYAYAPGPNLKFKK